MKILIISDFNIGGQCTALMRAINKYTGHEARCIIAHDDSFAYDRDILLGKETLQEAQYLANEWADFFHFGSYIFNYPGVDFNKLVTKNNCCIKYYGSFLRDRGEFCRQFHERTGIAAITGTDWTITGLLPNSYYHLSSYFTRFGDMNEWDIPECERYEIGDGLFRICASSAGHPNKRYDILSQVVAELEDEGYPIQLDLISGVSNVECLERKEKCHATFSSLGGGWGISGVESMYLGHVVFTSLDSFVVSLHPDQPAIIVDEKNLKESLIRVINDEDLWLNFSIDSRRFAIETFESSMLVRKYMALLDHIANQEKNLKGGNSYYEKIKGGM